MINLKDLIVIAPGYRIEYKKLFGGSPEILIVLRKEYYLNY